MEPCAEVGQPARVEVIILNWNGLHFLERCLSSVLAQSHPHFDVILVDNGSSDGSQQWVASRFPTVRLLCSPHNLGFAAGNNLAIAAGNATYVALLNNDTWVEPNWLTTLVAAMDGNPQVGMCASKMIFADRPWMINSTGISMDPVGIAWDRDGGALDDPDSSALVEIFGPCAGAGLYRRSMLEQIGLFDSDFFAYLEDVDLAWRAQLCGWRCLYAAAARVYHVHSGTAGAGSDFKARLLGRNKVWTILKNYPAGRLLAYLPMILLYDLAAALYATASRRNLSALHGRLDGLRGIRAMWPKRRAVQRLRRQWGSEALHWHQRLDPLIPPWQIPARYRHLHKIGQRQDTIE